MHMPVAAPAAFGAVLLFFLTQTSLAADSAASRLAAVRSGRAQMNGVNLGSWLVLEQWMAPQVYKAVRGSRYGELQLMLAAKKQGRTSALRAAIKSHRRTWVTEANFRLAASQGINAVRVPVGYWVMAGTASQAAPFVEGGYKYLDLAMTWGARHGIGVLIDFHAAPGSQNGYDNSAPAVRGTIRWDQKAAYQRHSVQVIAALAARYGRNPALLGFGLLNEPIVNRGPLEAYYKAGYAAVRKHSSDCFVVISPRVYEQDGSSWQHFMTGYHNVLQDLHRYQTDFAGPQFASLSVQQQIQYAADQKGALERYISGGGLKPLIGEWALAGPNYNFDGRQAAEISSFYQAQRSAYLQQGSAGWFQWSLKNSYNNDVWNFDSAVKYGWLHK